LNRNTLLGLGAGLVAGLAVGYYFGFSKGSEEAPVTVASAPAGAAPAVPPTSAFEVQQRIAMGQQMVARDPKNVQAWIGLGNDYFDSHQREKAIEAYGKALALAPNNPDVLTDQGVMYRETGAFDKAIANFEKANQLDPRHMQSLYNLGVVYAHDLKDASKAIKAWSQIIEANPTSPLAAQARQSIDEIKKR
jgi:tetratricopeptide (TPR) repeat protein